jgi:hypothetical protein
MTALYDMQRQFHDAVLGDGETTKGSAVYRRTVQGSLVNALAATFPVTRRIVGGKAFADIARAFVLKTLPQRPQLSAYGDVFPAALAGHTLPYLADVARLEWARNESYFAADAPAFDFKAFALMPADAMAAAQLKLHPATRVIESRYPIQLIWGVNQHEEVPLVDMSAGECVLVTRMDHHVTSRAISPGDAAFLRRIAEGKTLGEAAGEDFDLQTALAAHFSGWTFRN